MATITDFVKVKRKKNIIEIVKENKKSLPTSNLNNPTAPAQKISTGRSGSPSSKSPSIVKVPAGQTAPINTQPTPITKSTITDVQRQAIVQQRQQSSGVTKQITSVQSPQKVISKPTITKQITGSTRNPRTGRDIPVVEYNVISPPSQGGGAATKRKATSEEIASTRELVIDQPSKIPSSVRDVGGKISDTIGSIDYKTSKKARDILNLPDETKEQRFKNIDVRVTRAKQQAAKIESPILRNIQIARAEVGGQTLGFIGGFAESTLDSPIKRTGKNIIIGAGLGYGFGVASATASTIGGTVGGITTGAINVGGIGLGAAYTGNKLYQYETAGTTSGRGKVLGETGQEILLVGSGFKVGEVGAIKTQGAFTKYGRTKLDVYDIGVAPSTEVLSGKTKFLESSNFGGKNRLPQSLKQIQDIAIFRRAGRSYTATPEGGFLGKKFQASKGSSEFKGLYVAPSPSYYFLKAGEQKKGFFGLYRGIGNPKLAQIQKGKFTTKINSEGAFVTGIKPEIEAVYSEGTSFIRTGKQTYFEYKGRPIAMDIYEVSSTKKAVNTKSTKDISSSYSSGGGSSSFLNPSISYSLSSTSSSGDYSSRSSIWYSKPSATKYTPSLSGKSSRSSKISGSSSSSSSSSFSPSLSSGSGKSSRSSLSSFSRSSSSSVKRQPTSFKSFQSQQPFPLLRNRIVPFSQQPSKQYIVEVRRFGKFKPIAYASSVSRAFNLGRQNVASTLAASFRVRGVGSKAATPRGFKKSKKEKDVFIELPQFRLSKTKETKEIASFRTGRLRV